jgi:biopolymer transport protein ExbD
MQFKRSTHTETLKNNYMISLTDIMFIILLFFILTPSFNHSSLDDESKKGLIIDIPVSHNATIVSAPIEITINAQLSYFIDDAPIMLADIKNVLQEKLNQQSKSILLRIDKTVPIQNMIQIVDIAHTLHTPIAVETKQEDLSNE